MSHTDTIFAISMLCLVVITAYGTYKKNHSIEENETVVFIKDMTAINILSEIMEQDCEHAMPHKQEVTVSAYTACEEECDPTPEMTADGTPSRIGLLAVSRDLEHLMGKRVIIKGLGVFVVADLMNKRYSNRADILHANKKAARLFGTKKLTLIWLEEIDSPTPSGT